VPLAAMPLGVALPATCGNCKATWLQTGQNHVIENAAKLNFVNLLRRKAKT
jgi:hypothetical protein